MKLATKKACLIFGGGNINRQEKRPLVSHVSLDKVDDGRKAHTTRPCLTFYQCSGRPGFVFLPKGGCNPRYSLAGSFKWFIVFVFARPAQIATQAGIR